MQDNIKYEVYDDRNPEEVLFSHKSNYPCGRFIDRLSETEAYADHLWIRIVPDESEE